MILGFGSCSQACTGTGLHQLGWPWVASELSNVLLASSTVGVLLKLSRLHHSASSELLHVALGDRIFLEVSKKPQYNALF